MKTHLNPEGVTRPTGAYTQVVIAEGRRTVYIAGQVALDENGVVVGRGDAEKQVRQIFHNLEVILRAAGGTLQDIVKFTIYDTDIDGHTEALRRVRREVLGTTLPASTKVQVVRLAQPDYLLEVDAIAVLDR